MAAVEGEQTFQLSESYVKARNDYFHRVIKWFYKDQTLSEISEPEIRSPDFAFLVCLLQAIGFDLHRIEMVPAGSPIKMVQGSVLALCSINIKCERSGLQAVLRSRSDSEATSTTNSDTPVKQENIEGTCTMAGSLLPPVTPGKSRVTREIISQLMSLFSGEERTGYRAPEGCTSWTCPRTKQRPEITQCERRASLDTFFPVDSSAKGQHSGLNLDTGEIAATMAGSNEALYSCPGSPLLGGNSVPQLVRQKTWSIGSIQELDNAPASISTPPLTSSPLQSQQQVAQNLENLSLNTKDPAVVDRLREACAKIHEALSILNSTKENMPGVSSPLPIKVNSKPFEGGKKIPSSKISKPTPSSTAGNSSLRPAQRPGTFKRQRSPARGTKSVVTPKPAKRCGTISTPPGKLSTPTNTQDNEIRSGSFINMSDPTTGSPKLFSHASNSAPGRQNRANSPPVGENRRSGTLGGSSSSLQTSHSASNLSNAFITPGFRRMLTGKGSGNAGSTPCTGVAPNALNTPPVLRTSSASSSGSKSVLRPSLLKTPSIISRFKK